MRPMLWFFPYAIFQVVNKVQGKTKSEESMFQQRCMYVCIFADTVDCGFIWMKGNTFMVFEEWGPTPATLGSCYPLLCLCSWGDFNEYSCSRPLLAPVRLSTGLPPSSLIVPAWIPGPSTARMKSKMEARWSNWIIDMRNSRGYTSRVCVNTQWPPYVHLHLCRKRCVMVWVQTFSRITVDYILCKN